MQAFGFKSDDLLDFIGELRRYGYRITPEQCISAHNLVLALAAFGNPNDLAARLRTYLCPILCTSPEEQEGFERYFNQWQYCWTNRPAITKESKRSDALLERVYKEASSLIRNRSLLLILIGIVVITVAFALFGWIKWNPTPITNNPSQFSTQTLIVISTSMVLIISAALFGFSLLRRATLRKQLAGEDVKVEQLFVEGDIHQFARVFAVRRIAQELRHPEVISSSEIDVAATIDETIMKGVFTAVISPRRASPEYLVLIDRAGFDDQQARLADQVVQRLRKSDVYIDRFYFQRDPRLCRRDDGRAIYVSLRELAALYGNRRLIIFGDGAAFFNPISGRLEGWTSIFSNWQRRVVLTPQDINTDYRRWALLDQGFVVMPAGKESLSAVADILNETPFTPSRSIRSEPFPTVLLDRPERWVDTHSPSNDILDDLCGELIRFLGEAGYRWLGACAVYPMLHWDLTLYLGNKLSSEFKVGSEWVDQSFNSLMQLPWFRHGSIPDWLRTRLISDLSFDQKRRVRRIIEALLISSLRNPRGIALSIVIQQSEGNGIHSPIRPKLRDVISTAPSESLLRDHVFVSFMTRFTYNELVVTVPQKVRKALTYNHRSAVSHLFSSLANYLRHGYEFLIRPSGSQKKRSPLGARQIPEKKHLIEAIRDEISKLWNTPATYTGRLFPFAYYSLGAWILWALQYALLLATSSTNAGWVFVKTGLSLRLMENALWASAVLSLYLKQFARKSLTLPLLAILSVVISVAAYETEILTFPLVFQMETVLTAAMFMALAYWIVQFRLSEISAGVFFVHGYSQWIWKSLWLTPSGTPLIVQLAFPAWRIVLLIAWIKLMLDLWKRVQSPNSIIDGLQVPRSPFPLRVMISSTVEDLSPEREAADRAISDLKLTTIRAETLGSFPQSPEAIYAFMAEHCDIFVLIIGQRYGFEIKSKTISVVEFEYEVARAQNRGKILLYVKEGVTREPRLEEFVRRLEDFETGHFRSLFKTPEELSEMIKHDIARWINFATKKGRHGFLWPN